MLSPRLDPNLRVWLEFAAAQNRPPMCTVTPAEGRVLAMDALKDFAGDPEPVASVEDRYIPGPGGRIWIRVYTPHAAAPRPALVYFHGGGWVLFSPASHDVIARAIARRAGAVVISVDYRLAPEHKFPAAVEDAYAATQWVSENAASLGADPSRISIGGDSAGGTLATVVTMLARDCAGPALALQALVYPVTDLSSYATPSYVEFAEGYQLSKSTMEWFRGHYLAAAEDALDPRASPLLAPNLAGLPPALVITAECDPLRDEGEAYAGRLRTAGVPVTSTRYDGMIHPFFSMSGVVPQASDALQQVAAAVASAHVTPPAA